ncbi:MAG: ATP-binding protein [Bacteriovorax sp.]
MKKILISRFPIIIASFTLLIVTCFLRYNLYVNSDQLSKEFLNQNANEIYSIDTLKLSSRLNSFSRALNWVCIQGEVNGASFFHAKRGTCDTDLFQQKVQIFVPEANNLKISLTLKLSKDLELLFSLFLLFQLALIISLIIATKISEEDKRQQELKFLQLSRKMFHDIRSPLASLNTIAQGMNFSQSIEEQIFKGSISRINDIANSLLSTTQKQIIQLPLFQETSSVIKEIIAEKKIEFANRELTLVFESTTDAKAFFEPIEFKRILSNLINNSIEAANNSKISIQIKAQLKEQSFLLDIIDNGTGIPQKILTKLGQEEISTKKKGNGLGIKEAADSMKEWTGQLEILETSPAGTTIRLIFKAKVEVKQYYLIDDDTLVRMTWESRAKKNGISLQTFNSHHAFFEIKNSIPKDSVIFIDSELGNIKGEDIALTLHEEGFIDLSITSGHPAENFKKFNFLRSVISKAAPF